MNGYFGMCFKMRRKLTTTKYSFAICCFILGTINLQNKAYSFLCTVSHMADIIQHVQNKTIMNMHLMILMHIQFLSWLFILIFLNHFSSFRGIFKGIKTSNNVFDFLQRFNICSFLVILDMVSESPDNNVLSVLMWQTLCIEIKSIFQKEQIVKSNLYSILRIKSI